MRVRLGPDARPRSVPSPQRGEVRERGLWFRGSFGPLPQPLSRERERGASGCTARSCCPAHDQSPRPSGERVRERGLRCRGSFSPLPRPLSRERERGASACTARPRCPAAVSPLAPAGRGLGRGGCGVEDVSALTPGPSPVNGRGERVRVRLGPVARERGVIACTARPRCPAAVSPLAPAGRGLGRGGEVVAEASGLSPGPSPVNGRGERVRARCGLDYGHFTRRRHAQFERIRPPSTRRVLPVT